jgi:hypothetical protein
VGTWQDSDLGRPIAAPLERCAELLGVDLATISEAAANVEPYLRADGTRIWSLMHLERLLRPEAYAAGGEAGTSTVDRRPVAHPAKRRPDQDDWHLQEPPWPTPTSKNIIGSPARRGSAAGPAEPPCSTSLNCNGQL